ncbi:uncharacterized protein M8220_017240 isoform 2-T3 [Acridotheres tristis]
MKVAVLSVALLFSILLCLPAQAKATFDGSGGAICAGRVGGIAVGDVAIGEAAGGCIVKKNGVQRVKRSEPLVAEQVELLRE